MRVTPVIVRAKNSIAISAWVLALAAGVCEAQSIGTVTDLQGALLSKNAAGTIKILAPDSSIESGDRLLTRPGTYARLVFTDRTAVTLGPESELAIVQYAYSDTAPANSALFDFVQGRLQLAAGRVGARSVDRFLLNTPSGTIAVGHATFLAGFTAPPRAARLHAPVGHFVDVVYHPPSDSPSAARLLLAQSIPIAAPGVLTPGLYVQVLDGAISVTNGGGTQSFSAGQFGFTPSNTQPPVILPANPGLQFTPPPAINVATPAPASASSALKQDDVDCVVR
jgi:hypothetical protein